MNKKKPRLTSASAKALADKAIGGNVIPKKIPAVDDIEGQKKALIGALSSALLTATEIPVHVLQPHIAPIVDQLAAYGIRQTEHIDLEAQYAPAWITDGVRQQSIKLPEQAKHTEDEPFVARTAVAPSPPKRIAKHARAVKR